MIAFKYTVIEFENREFELNENIITNCSYQREQLYSNELG